MMPGLNLSYVSLVDGALFLLICGSYVYAWRSILRLEGRIHQIVTNELEHLRERVATLEGFHTHPRGWTPPDEVDSEAEEP